MQRSISIGRLVQQHVLEEFGIRHITDRLGNYQFHTLADELRASINHFLRDYRRPLPLGDTVEDIVNGVIAGVLVESHHRGSTDAGKVAASFLFHVNNKPEA